MTSRTRKHAASVPRIVLKAVLLAAFAIPALLGPHAAAAQAKPSHAKPPKPDLHAGGFDPSSIPNDAVTEVTLPGSHLTGAKIDTAEICKLVSYTVTSDNEIKMSLKGVRPVDELDGRCTVTIHTPGGTASTWIVVELTDEQEQQQEDHLRAQEKAKAAAFISRSGKTWHLSFAGGSTETYTSAGANDDAMPIFQNSAGTEVRIAVSDDNTALIFDGGCIRSGKLVGNEVKNGQSRGECTPPGSWTATVVH